MKQKKGYRRLLDAFVICLTVFYSIQGEAAVLQQCEKMTNAEKVELTTAEKKVAIAQREVDAVKKKIAAAHNFHEEYWMEWRSWVEFDGDFILLKHRSFMSGD